MQTRNSTTPAWSRWIGHAGLTLTALMGLYLGATIGATRDDWVRATERLPLDALPGVIGLVFMFGWLFWSWHSPCTPQTVPDRSECRDQLDTLLNDISAGDVK